MSMLAVGVIVVLGLFLAPQVFPDGKHIEVKIVKSGSMEPAIKTGGIVTIRPVAEYRVGDVITFTSDGADIPTTHRIIGTEFLDGVTQFVTKGDANEERDTELVLPHMIVGKVLFSVPYLGFILDFARQPIGFSLLVGIPAFLIIFDEVDKIVREMRERRKKKLVLAQVPVQTGVPPQDLDTNTRMMRMADIRRREQPLHMAHASVRSVEATLMKSPVQESVERIVIVAVCALGMVYMNTLGSTISYFADIESALANALRAQALDFTVSADNTTFVFNDAVPQDPGFVVTTTVTPEGVSVPLRYKVSVDFVSGTTTLCSALGVSSSDPFGYDGPILGLEETDVAFSNSWELRVALNSGEYVVGDTCVLDLVFHAWNSNYLIFDDGYDDDERVQLMFSIASATSLGARVLDVPPTEGEQIIEEIVEKTEPIVEDETIPEEIPEETPTPISLVEGSNEVEEEPEAEEPAPEPPLEEEPEAETPPETVEEVPSESEVTEVPQEETPSEG